MTALQLGLTLNEKEHLTARIKIQSEGRAIVLLPLDRVDCFDLGPGRSTMP